MLFLPLTFSIRRFGHAEGRSEARRGRKGDRKGRRGERPGEGESKRAHGIHHRVNYPHAPENISRHRSIQAYTDRVSPCVRSQPTVSSEDAMLLRPEETGLFEEKPGPPTDQLTPISGPVLPSPPSAAVEPERPTVDLEVTTFLRFVSIPENMLPLCNEAYLLNF